MVYTSFTKLVGRAPIIVAGMTPTTANAAITIAFTQAGFHGELAAGGLPRPDIFQSTIRQISAKISTHDSQLVPPSMTTKDSSRGWNSYQHVVLELKTMGLSISVSASHEEGGCTYR